MAIIVEDILSSVTASGNGELKLLNPTFIIKAWIGKWIRSALCWIMLMHPSHLSFVECKLMWTAFWSKAMTKFCELVHPPDHPLINIHSLPAHAKRQKSLSLICSPAPRTVLVARPLPVMTKPPSPEAINVPIKRPPDDFKKEHKHSQSTMTTFAPIDCHRPCPSAEKEVRDQLYITDNKTVYKWALKKIFIFRIFKLVYWLYRWAYDAFGLSPTWHSVMYVDDIVKNNKLVHVTDTLVLHIDTISSFEKLIPFICGPFTRLTIHGGDIKLDQLKRLMWDTVRKVEITAQIQLKPDEYDDAVRLITEHVRGFRYVFNLKSTPQLITKLKPIVESSRYLHVQNPSPDDCNVIHWKARWLDMFILQCQIGLLVFLAGFWIGIVIGCKNTPMIQVLSYQNTVNSSSEGVDVISLLIYSTLFFFIICFVLGLARGSKPDF